VLLDGRRGVNQAKQTTFALYSLCALILRGEALVNGGEAKDAPTRGADATQK
jgi:hypothetical protein